MDIIRNQDIKRIASILAREKQQKHQAGLSLEISTFELIELFQNNKPSVSGVLPEYSWNVRFGKDLQECSKNNLLNIKEKESNVRTIIDGKTTSNSIWELI